MKRLLLLLLALAFCLTLAACKAPATATYAEDPTQTSEEPEDFTGKPTLQLRVNENYWLTADLTPYLGSEWAWVSFDVPMEYLAEGFNQFALYSNAYNHGNLTDKSVDLFFTFTEFSTDSFLSADMMNSWEPFTDRFANVMLELYDGESWNAFPRDPQYQLDENMVLGIYTPNNAIYSVCRNIELHGLEGYRKATLSALVHVGTNLLEEPEPEPIDEGDGVSELDTTVPVLKVKLNGAPCERVDLTPYLGSDSVWVMVPLDASKLRDGTNRITLDSNVDNTQNFADTSLDIYFTASRTSEDTELSTNGRLSWMKIEDHRYANIYLELHDAATDTWTTCPGEEIYRDTNEHTVIGLFTANEWQEQYHFRRAFVLENVAQYDQVRAYIQIHVGSNLKIVE